MRILLDEMIPRRLAPLLAEHEVVHVVELGWRQFPDGQLLTRGESAGFEAFITRDGNLPYQQNLTGRQIAILVLRPATQDFLDLESLAPDILRILPNLERGSVTRVPPA